MQGDGHEQTKGHRLADSQTLHHLFLPCKYAVDSKEFEILSSNHIQQNKGSKSDGPMYAYHENDHHPMEILSTLDLPADCLLRFIEDTRYELGMRELRIPMVVF